MNIMANKNLFKSQTNNNSDNMAKNNAGGKAYNLSNKAALAQIASTGCFSNTYYTSGKQQLDEVKNLCQSVASEKDGLEYIAKLAIFSRERAYMKDMPSYLLSFLAIHCPELYEKVFDRVVDSAKILRNHVQIVRSGQIDGRVSLPRAMRRQLRRWFAKIDNELLFRNSVGNSPSMSDVIKMVHPKPRDAAQEATFSYLMNKSPIKGRKFGSDESNLPKLVKEYESYKATRLVTKERGEVPNVPFQMLDSLGLDTLGWCQVAKNAKWQMTRMNLNTFNRHGVFNRPDMVEMVANRLESEKDIKKSKAFPYQLMSAYLSATDVPNRVKEALNNAMEVSIENIPVIDGNVYIFVDVSGSMSSPITGYSTTKVSTMKCVEVASLIAASFARRNPNTKVIPFDTKLHHNYVMKPNNNVMKTANELAKFGGGGTDCGLGVKYLADRNEKVDLVIYVSDNESWVGQNGRYGRTGMMNNWEKIKKNNPDAKLVCIDLTPNTTTQANEKSDVFNIGGFSDNVWDLICHFNSYGNDSQHWVDQINNICL